MAYTKPISDVCQGNPITSTYQPVKAEMSTLLTELARDATDGRVGKPLVILAIGQSNMRGLAAATEGDHVSHPKVFAFNNDLLSATVAGGTSWGVATFGVAPLNIGSAPYANNMAFHHAKRLAEIYNVPVYVYILAKASTQIEAWIKNATLTANGWTRTDQDLSAIMYPGLANALALVPGAPTSVDFVDFSQGNENISELSETYGAKVTALMADLAAANLINISTTPIIATELTQDVVAALRFRHLNGLIRAQEDTTTLRIARTSGLPLVSSSPLHMNGFGLEDIGKRMAVQALSPPDRVDYRVEPLQLSIDNGLRFWTHSTNSDFFDMSQRQAYVSSNPLSLSNDANIGWAFLSPTAVNRQAWSRRIFPTPKNGTIAMEIQAITYDAVNPVPITLSINQWDKDGVFISLKNKTLTTLTSAMGATNYRATFALPNFKADVALDATCAYFCFGFRINIGMAGGAIVFKLLAAQIEPATVYTTVALLPTAASAGAGTRAAVSNALSPTFGSAVAGGGAVTVGVISTGAVWNVG